jgi:hypothetical protein
MESLRVCGRGKFVERSRVCGRGKFAESSRVRVLKVLGKFEG